MPTPEEIRNTLSLFKTHLEHTPAPMLFAYLEAIREELETRKGPSALSRAIRDAIDGKLSPR